MEEVINGILIREVETKNIMTKSSLPVGGYSVNPYVGCTHACKYCYASFMKRFTGHTEEWGTFLDVKHWPKIKNPKKYAGQRVVIGSVTDGYNPQEEQFGNTRKLLEQLIGSDADILICTKSDLVVRDIDLLKKLGRVTVSWSINTLDENFKNDMDSASSIERRIAAMKQVYEAGIRTVCFVSPVFPGITDFEAIFERVKDQCDLFWLENLNLRGGFKKTIMDYIAEKHPDLVPLYDEIYNKENFCGMTIKGMVYDDKKAAGERLLLARQEMPNADMMLLGTYRGFELNIRFDSFKNEHQAVLRAELSYPVSLGDDARGNITRLDNAIDNFADRIADAENALQNLEQQKQAAEVEVAKPFAQEEELAEKSARLAELNALLNIDCDRSSSQDTPEEYKETEAPATRPSVLAALGEKINQSEPVKPFRSYYDKDGDAR